MEEGEGAESLPSIRDPPPTHLRGLSTGRKWTQEVPVRYLRDDGLLRRHNL